MCTICAHGLSMNNGPWFRSMGKDGGRKRKRKIERLYERGKMGARMPEASLKSLRVSVSALASDKDGRHRVERREEAREREGN